MPRYLKTLNTVQVYSTHSKDALPFTTIKAGEYVSYNREKRRDGINWIEIYMSDGEKAYVKKNRAGIFLCRLVTLSDTEAKGFGYELPEKSSLTFADIFTPMMPGETAPLSSVEVKQTEDSEKGKYRSLTLSYDPSITKVKEFEFRKDDRFYIVYDHPLGKDAFIEVDDFGGRKGFLLKKTNYSEQKDAWIMPLAVIIMIATIGGTIAAFLASGWLVISGLMIIPAIILAFLAILAVKIIIMILEAIVHQVRIRL